MQPVLPAQADLRELTSHRDEACVSIYLRSSPIPRESDESRIALKGAVAHAERELKEKGIDPEQLREIIGPLEDLDDDPDFWTDQTRGFAIFAAPGFLRVFRLINDLRNHLAVGDRFDIGMLLRAVSFSHEAFVLTLTEGTIELYTLSSSQAVRHLELQLPDDVHSVLEYTTNEDDSPMPRAQGANGEKTEQRKYCRIVQDAVLNAIGDSTIPLILAASTELEPAYRAINRYRHLAEQGIGANPESLSLVDLTERARAILDDLHSAELASWWEHFEVERSRDKATTDLGHVARAATAAAIDELVFDMDSPLEGSIDEAGALEVARGVSADSYGIVDEIAARVLRSGGTVRAVRSADMPVGSPVAAVLRYPY